MVAADVYFGVNLLARIDTQFKLLPAPATRNVFLFVCTIYGKKFEKLPDSGFDVLGILRAVHLGYRSLGEKAFGVAVRFEIELTVGPRLLKYLVRLAVNTQSDQNPDLLDLFQSIV